MRKRKGKDRPNHTQRCELLVNDIRCSLIPFNHVAQSFFHVRSLQGHWWVTSLPSILPFPLTPPQGQAWALSSWFSSPYGNSTLLDTMPLSLSKIPVGNSLIRYESAKCCSPKYYLENMQRKFPNPNQLVKITPGFNLHNTQYFFIIHAYTSILSLSSLLD